jgi:hypothetical protein
MCVLVIGLPVLVPKILQELARIITIEKRWSLELVNLQQNFQSHLPHQLLRDEQQAAPLPRRAETRLFYQGPLHRSPPSTHQLLIQWLTSPLFQRVSSTDSQRGLPSFILKQLVFDIEEAGGIKNLAKTKNHILHGIVDQRPELYGKRGDPRRSQIQKKVWGWKQLHKEGKYFEQVLNRLQVKSFSTLQFEEKNRKKNGRKLGDEFQTSTSSGSDSESISSSESISVPKKERASPPRVIDTRTPRNIDTTKMSASPRTTSNTPVPRGAGKIEEKTKKSKGAALLGALIGGVGPDVKEEGMPN